MTEQELRELHRLSSGHRDRILGSQPCGCFCCRSVFPPERIVEWVDEGRTALCPKCGIDAVLPESVGLTDQLLREMSAYWFGGTGEI